MYRVRVQGKLDPVWSNWLASMSIVSETTADGCLTTVLTGLVADQAALRGVLSRLWDLNLDIISVNRIVRRGEKT